MNFLKHAAPFIAVLAALGRLANAEEVRSPCESREPPLTTCSDFGAACVAYFSSPVAPTDTLRKEMMGDLDASFCAGWKNQCLKDGMWRGPNCVIINVKPE